MPNIHGNRKGRIAKLSVSLDFWLDMLVHGAKGFKPERNRLPDDVEIVGAYAIKGILTLILTSDHFRELAEGEPVPFLSEPTFRSIDV